MSDLSQKFEAWCIVELFGHSRIAGLVTEQTIGAQTFVRVDVPAVEHEADRYHDGKHETYLETVPAFTKFYGASAIYALTPTSEEVARAIAGRLVVRAINPFELPQLRQLAEPNEEDLEAEADRDDEDDDDLDAE